MKITYWSDYACPWCYIGVSRLKNAIKELGVESLVTLKMRAYQLDPGAPLKAESDNITKAAARFGVSKEEAMAKMRQMFDMAKANGIEFNYATARNTNTFDAHRLTKLAESKGDEKLLNAMIDRLYKAYFTDNLSLRTMRPLSPSQRKRDLTRQRSERCSPATNTAISCWETKDSPLSSE